MINKKVRFERRVNHVAKRLAERREKQDWKAGQRGKVPFKRKFRKSRVVQMIAYDLETDRIAEGIPNLRYVTAFGNSFFVSKEVRSIEALGLVLRERFLTAENNRCRFIGWNANKFDSYFVSAAMLTLKGYEIRPYLTRSKNLRGMKIEKKVKDGEKKQSWEFLDGMAMTGLDTVGTSLKDFLDKYAPEFPKLTGAVDFSKEEFEPSNPEHRRYAERDSEGLYVAMQRANQIVMDAFNIPLQPTMGNCGIRIFQANMPWGTQCWQPPFSVLSAIRNQVMRGGYCYAVKKFDGPVWKYDINQAYAAAMRESWMPAGRCYFTKKLLNNDDCAIYRLTATKAGDLVPFYYRGMDGESRFDKGEILETWLTSIEVNQLVAEGWALDILEGWAWDDAFRMSEYVDKLESTRMTADGGPKGAIGTMIKVIGNSSYGKTVEKLDGLELRLSIEQPAGMRYYGTDEDELQHVWFAIGEPLKRDYHQPQIGAFITAYVRMVLRRAILLAPSAFLYADTDCVMFGHAVDLPLDSGKYGMWKQETNGEVYKIIAKKVYASADGTTAHAKGMNVKRMTMQDFDSWYAGSPPLQKQLQRVSYLQVMSGASMFKHQEKYGQTPAYLLTRSGKRIDSNSRARRADNPKIWRFECLNQQNSSSRKSPT